jgi:hypothetical protein
VSGTTPEAMLSESAEPDPRFGTDPPTVFRPVGSDGRLVTYRWASQTSGTAASAMWLLLVPYMLLNVAGWALPPATTIRHRLSVAAVRIAGLLLTLVFALVIATGVIGVGAYQVVRPALSWDVALTLGVVVSAMVMALLWFATTRADEARNDRPYLRAMHIAMALWGIWATAATVVAETTDRANPIGTTWLLPASLAVVAVAVSMWHGLEDVTRLLGRLAVAASLLLLATVTAAPLDPVADLPSHLISVGGPLRGAVVAYGIAALAVTALAWSPSHPDSGPAVATLMALAGATGASVGAGAVVLSGLAFGVRPTEATGALAEAFLVGTLAVLAAVAIHLLSHLEPGTARIDRLFRTIGSVRDDARPLLLAIPAVTLAVGVVSLGGFSAVLPWLGAFTGGAATLTTSVLLLRLEYRVAAIVSVVAGAGLAALVWSGVATFTVVSVVFTLVLPLMAVIIRIVGAVGDVERRRFLAIPWDVGSFFSRRFHPFAPPTYRDVVERDLRLVLAQVRGGGDRIVLSAHSQGSIVALTALDPTPGDGVTLLTHGSPLGSLYMRFFPISFPPDVADRVGPRPWINLWRPTDPIGGRIAAADDRRIDDTHLRIHGGYWFADELEYARAVADLQAAESPR